MCYIFGNIPRQEGQCLIHPPLPLQRTLVQDNNKCQVDCNRCVSRATENSLNSMVVSCLLL